MMKFLKSKAVKLMAIGVILATTLGVFSGTNVSITSPLTRNTIDLRVGYVRIAMASGNMDYPLTQTGIQNALNALPATGGRLNLMSTSGTVTFAGTVSRAIPNVTIVGTGNVPLVQNNGVTPLFSVGGQTGWVFRDLSTDAGGITLNSDTVLDNVHLGTTYYALASTGTANFTTLNAPTGRGATLVVASVNATAIEKAQADYICDGIADDVQIQTAINALPSASGGTVLLSEGVFNLASQITVSSNVTIEGRGMGATIISAPSGTIDAIRLNADYATVKDLWIRGPGALINLAGIDDLGGQTRGIRVQNVKLTQWFRAINFNALADQSYIINNYIDTCGYGMDLWRSNNVHVEGNSIININRYGIYLNAMNHSTITGNTISNWDLTAGGYQAIVVGNSLGSTTGVVIANNSIYGNTNANALSSAIVVSGEGNNANKVTNFTIIGNTINGTVGHGIGGIYLHSFDGTHDNVRNGTIVGNTVSGYDDGFQSAWGQGITWQGNTSSYNGKDGYLISVGTNQILNGNIARNNSVSAANTYDGFRIQSASTNVTLTGNLAYDDQPTPTQRYGIAEFTADCVGTRYDNNTLGVGATGQFNSVGSSFKVYNNTGYVTENSGNFTINSNLWGVSVNHGLSTNATSVQLTLTSNATAIPYILAPITTTAFSVNLTALQGSSITGYWRAVYGAGN